MGERLDPFTHMPCSSAWLLLAFRRARAACRPARALATLSSPPCLGLPLRAASEDVAAPLLAHSIPFDCSTAPTSLHRDVAGFPPPPQQRMHTEAHSELRFLDACWHTLCFACASPGSRPLPSPPPPCPLTGSFRPRRQRPCHRRAAVLGRLLGCRRLHRRVRHCTSASHRSAGTLIEGLMGAPPQSGTRVGSGVRASAAGALPAFGGPALPAARRVGMERGHCATPSHRARQALTDGAFLFFFAFSPPTPLRLPLRST